MSPSSEPARSRILAAAEELFAEHGYDRTSTARLARAAGVPPSLVSYHFATKEEVLLSLLRERAGTTLAALELPAPSGDLHATIADLWRHLRAHLAPERDNHPALRDRARRFETDTAEQVARHLVAATGAGSPGHLVAARLLFTAASAIEHDLDAYVVATLLVSGLG